MVVFAVAAADNLDLHARISWPGFRTARTSSGSTVVRLGENVKIAVSKLMTVDTLYHDMIIQVVRVDNARLTGKSLSACMSFVIARIARIATSCRSMDIQYADEISQEFKLI